MLTTAAAARALGVTPRRVRALIKSGALPATKHGRDWIVTEAAVQGLNRRSVGRPRRIEMEFIELGTGTLEEATAGFPFRGRWTVIRDDDAATAGAPCWWAAKASPKAAAAAYEASGGTVSAVYTPK